MNNDMDERLLNSPESGEDDGDLKKRVWVESKKMWRVAFPGILARVSQFGLMVVTQSFIGHISELDLAAFALVQTLTLRFANGILLGMSSATETLCGQAFGAGQDHMMGIYLQRSWIVDIITATILLPIFIFTTPLFKLLGEVKSLAEESEKISIWCIPFVYSFVFSLTMQLYLQAQLKNMFIAWLSVSSFIIHLMLSWLLVITLNLGIPGAMASLAISAWVVVLGEFVYVFGGWCPHSWKGFSKAAFHDLWPVVKLSVSSGIMLCLELWYNSILVLVAGYMKNAETEISAFSICLNISAWQFMLCLGFLGAATVRVANELGRGNAKAAKFSIKVIMSTSVILGLLFFTLCLIFGHKIGYIFTTEEEVADTVSELSVLLAFTMLLNSIQPVLTGVAVGAGLQGLVAVINLLSYYAIGVPIGAVLAYVADLKIQKKMNNEVDERLLNSSEFGELDDGNLKRRIWVESKKMWRVAFPGILTTVSSFGLMVVTQSFIGHISELDLAAYALVQTLVVRFVEGILLGMSSATESLCGQAFGAGQYHMMGIYLQRSWIVGFITATILLPIFIFSAPIFKLLGQEKSISEESEQISIWFISLVYSFVFSLTMQMYLKAQLKNMIVALFSAASFIIHIILSWLFVIKLNLKLPGAMGALVISSWLVVFGDWVYIFGGWCPHSWKGFTKAVFRDLWPVVKLSVSSGIMLCLEFWYNSILVLVAGYMKNAEIAISAFSICLNVSVWQFMFFLGFLAAASVRVGNELGKGNAKAAEFAIKVIMSTSVILGLLFFILCLIFGPNIGYIFTSNKEVAYEVSELSVLLAFTMLFNSIQPVLTGVAIGASLQSAVAIINLFCYYVIGVPIGVVLAYVAHLGLQGLWIGMLSGVAAQVIMLGVLIWRTNWDEQVNKASERLNRWIVKPSEILSERLNHP